MLENIKKIAPKTHAELSKFVSATETKAQKIADYTKQIAFYDQKLIDLENLSCKEPTNTKINSEIEDLLSKQSGLRSRLAALTSGQVKVFNREEVDKLLEVYAKEMKAKISPLNEDLHKRQVELNEWKQAETKRIQEEYIKKGNVISAEQSIVSSVYNKVGATLSSLYASFGLESNQVAEIMKENGLNYYNPKDGLI